MEFSRKSGLAFFLGIASLDPQESFAYLGQQIFSHTLASSNLLNPDFPHLMALVQSLADIWSDGAADHVSALVQKQVELQQQLRKEQGEKLQERKDHADIVATKDSIIEEREAEVAKHEARIQDQEAQLAQLRMLLATRITVTA